ncbi:MAG: bifunctional phosphopantothenoylcysteine decarboxylase/phosphopantothenate--cysteine ligase CoaBC [Flavobacteriales bacterium]|nr:bifunctional phosphopantothenoylcysteine decarboxylase/phosphopantothenate--cysteine ligase CoaBC [Flavobacteriales bacterium]
MLRGKKILIGVTGSIAAYKTAHLVRLLVKAGAEVRVLMTPAACDFISPLTLGTLSKHPVSVHMVSNADQGTWTNHVEMGMWADLLVVAPASANTIGKMANGICDNLLLAVYLSAKCPVMIAPAMDLDMYRHPSVKLNLSRLKEYGNNVLQAENGELASGLIGEGRMPEPENIFAAIEQQFSKKKKLSGKRILITAGPTHEAIDPVRFIGNSSSGKMGIAIAELAASWGAEVHLVCGPSFVESSSAVHRINVRFAAEMYKEVNRLFPSSDVAILSAAVADYRPKSVAGKKIKKADAVLNIELEPTADILKSLGEKKKKNQFLVGFALETDHEIENAKKKIKSKNLDLIVLNSLNDKGAGFGYDTNKITLIDRNNKMVRFELKSKQEVAADILNAIVKNIK